MKKALKIFLIFLAVIAVIYVVLVIIRAFHFYNLDKTNEQVARIHNTKLTMDDVMGKNLPPNPGSEADKTIQGIDTNKNGIRDDVELAIFKEYPNSAKTRAVLLQYALALQMEVVQIVVNKETVIATIQEEDRAYLCVGEILSRSNVEEYDKESEKLRSFVENKQLNTEQRKKYRTNFYEKIGSYNSLPRICDIDYSLLPN
ncbi:MAG: hypothetical protein AAB924_01760 [Patescibacteria group bacterium]